MLIKLLITVVVVGDDFHETESFVACSEADTVLTLQEGDYKEGIKGV